MKRKVISDFSRYSFSDLDTIVAIIIAKCKGNPHFTFVNDELVDVETTYGVYHSSLEASYSGSTVAVAEKNTARENLEEALRILAMTINIQAKHNEAILQSSGIELTDIPEPQVMDVIGDLRYRYVIGEEGVLELMVSKSKTVKDYGTAFAHAYEKGAPESIDDWTIEFTTAHKIILRGLTPGEVLLVSAARKGAGNKPLKWCPKIAIRIV